MTNEERQRVKHRVRARLSEYTHLEQERMQILDELTKLEARRAAPGTSKWDAMPRGGGGGDAMAAGLVQKEELTRRYIRKVEELEKAQLAIEVLIDILDPVERKLMRHRYIDGLTWEKVCVEMSYSWRQTHNIHARALDKLVDLLGAGEKAVTEVAGVTKYGGYYPITADMLSDA